MRRTPTPVRSWGACCALSVWFCAIVASTSAGCAGCSKESSSSEAAPSLAATTDTASRPNTDGSATSPRRAVPPDRGSDAIDVATGPPDTEPDVSSTTAPDGGPDDADTVVVTQPDDPAGLPEVVHPPGVCAEDSAELPLPGTPCATEGAVECTPVGQTDEIHAVTVEPLCFRPNHVVCKRTKQGELRWSMEPCPFLDSPPCDAPKGQTMCLHIKGQSGGSCCPLAIAASGGRRYGLCRSPTRRACSSYQPEHVHECTTPFQLVHDYPAFVDSVNNPVPRDELTNCGETFPGCYFLMPIAHCDACTAECDVLLDYTAEEGGPFGEGGRRFALCEEASDGTVGCGVPPPPTPGYPCICAHQDDPHFVRCQETGKFVEPCKEATAAAQGRQP